MANDQLETRDHILIVDDDPDILEVVKSYLEHNGFRVSTSQDGKGLRQQLERQRIDLIVLDLVLPNEDGLVICRNLRARSNLPVIILSAKDDQMDRIIGLEMGADDYLGKPFHPRELLARVKSVLRRSRALPQEGGNADSAVCFRFNGWELDSLSRNLTDNEGKLVPLSSSEYDMLRIFLSHPHKILTRDQLLELTSSREGGDPFDRTIDMQVSRLRKRLQDDPKNPYLIKTIRSAGYMFSCDVERIQK